MAVQNLAAPAATFFGALLLLSSLTIIIAFLMLLGENLREKHTLNALLIIIQQR